MNRRLWPDKALESERWGYIAVGAAGSGLVCGFVSLALCAVSGAPGWLYGVTLAGMAVCAVMLAAGGHEVREARRHRASMKTYGESITTEFERLLRREAGPR